MNITIKDDQALQSYLEFNKIQLKYWSTKANIRIWLFIVIGILLVSFDLARFNAPTITFFESRVYNLHLSLGVGISMIYFGLMLLFGKMNAENKAFAKRYSEAEKAYSTSNSKTTLIDENFVIISGDLFKYEFNWLLLSKFTIVGGFIVIYIDEIADAPIFIKAKNISDSEYQELYSFLRKKLNEIKK